MEESKIQVIKDLQQTIGLTENVAFALYQNNMELAQQNINIVIGLINRFYSHFITNGVKYLQEGEQMPVETLCAQMEDVNDAVVNTDILKLADALYYEIREGLMYFMELLKRGQVQQNADSHGNNG